MLVETLPCKSANGYGNSAGMTVELKGPIADAVNHGDHNRLRIVLDALCHGFKPTWKWSIQMWWKGF